MAEDEANATDEPNLVMGMPRRELFALSGFITKIEIDVLASLEEEHWFATSEQLAADLEAKEVQVGVVFRRDDQLLIDEQGVVLHTASIPPEVTALGPGLRPLREFARMGAERLVGSSCQNCTLIGYLNDDQFVECRPYFIMIYEVRFPPEAETPEHMVWIGTSDLTEVAIDPVSSLIIDGLP